MSSHTSIKALIYLVILLSVSACTSTHDFHRLSVGQSITHEKAITNPPDIFYAGFTPIEIEQNDIFALTPEQISMFRQYIESRSQENRPLYQLTADYLQRFAFGFDYASQTYNASTALAKKEGNCLSLAILSSAIAKVAGLDYKYKKVHSAPVHLQHSGLELISTHVNITLYDKREPHSIHSSTVVLVPASITIDYFRDAGSVTSDSIDEQALITLYWQNLASQAMLDKNWDLAFAYTIKANDINPHDSETLNLLAVLYSKINRKDLAASIYEYAYSQNIISYTLLDNYARLLKQQGEFTKAEKLLNNIKDINETNPYVWLQIGKERFSKGQMTLAQQYFERSAKLGPYLHEPKHHLAQVYVKQGKLNAAKQALIDAHKIAQAPVDRQRFQSKLYALKSLGEAD